MEIIAEYRTRRVVNAETGPIPEEFAAASKREFDILLFWSLDRLSREGLSRR